MGYSNGQGNVFINLSTASHNASNTDSLNGAADGITVTTLAKGAYGTVQNSTTQITAGSTDTVGSLISAINANTSLGLHASFVTAAQAGMTTNPTYTGIEITSSGTIGQGTTPGVLGTITALANGDAFSSNTDGITITTTDGKQHDVNVNGNDTLAMMASTINGMNLGVTASADTNDKVLTFTSANSGVQVTSSLYDNTGAKGSIGFSAGSGFYSVGISSGTTDINDVTSGLGASGSVGSK